MPLTSEMQIEASQASGISYVTSIAIRVASGRLVDLACLEASALVDCSSLWALRSTMERIMSDGLYAGMHPMLQECCAAAYSVPDGAPIAMAVDNIGCALSDAAAGQVASWQAEERALRRRFG